MLLSEIKSFFNTSLRFLYPVEEIESIFSYTVEYILKYSKLDIHQNLHKNIQPEAEKKILQFLFRLEKGEPIQYITGFAEFYGTKIHVDKQVLIPRQETEMLVNIFLKNESKNKILNIIDLCTGSGCISIALSKNLHMANVTATDISQSSLNLAEKNAAYNKCKIRFVQDDIFHSELAYEKFDCIISNPPYVCKSEKQYMHINVLNYEPASALFVDDSNPLVYYHAIASFALKYLTSTGCIYLEINENLAKETKELYEKSGFQEVKIWKDLQNKNRYLTIKK